MTVVRIEAKSTCDLALTRELIIEFFAKANCSSSLDELDFGDEH